MVQRDAPRTVVLSEQSQASALPKADESGATPATSKTGQDPAAAESLSGYPEPIPSLVLALYAPRHPSQASLIPVPRRCGAALLQPSDPLCS